MEITKVLDFYRIPVVSDEIAFSILSWLVKNGPVAIEDIVIAFGEMRRRDVEAKVLRLFQAGLLEYDSGMYNVNDYSSKILNYVGIAEVAAKSLVRINEKKNDSSWLIFIDACLSAQSTQENQILTSLGLLKALSNSWSGEYQQSRIKREDLVEVIFALVVGLNDDFAKMGVERFVEYILNWHQFNGSELWSSHGKSMKRHRDHFVDLCYSARDVTQKSNSMLSWRYTIDQVEEKDALLYMCRVNSPLMRQVPDSAFVYALLSSPEVTSNAAKVAFELTDKFSCKMYHYSGHGQIREPYISMENMVEKLEAGLTKFKSESLDLNPLCLAGKRGTFGRYVDKTEAIISQMSSCKYLVDAGELDNLSPSEKERIARIVSSLYHSVNKRFYSSADDGQK